MNMNTNTRRARNLTFAALGTLLAVAGSVAALPVALPFAIDQRVDTPAGSIAAQADENHARACIDARTPAVPALPVPALPALPVPVPVAVPSVNSISGHAASCADAGLDGARIDADADAMGLKAGTGAGADTSEQADTVEHTAGGVMGFLGGIKDRVLSLF